MSDAGVEVPWREIESATLTRFIEEFVTRQESMTIDDLALEERVNQIRMRLERELAVLLFDPTTETFTVALREALR